MLHFEKLISIFILGDFIHHSRRLAFSWLNHLTVQMAWNALFFVRAIQFVFLFCYPRARFLRILYSRKIQKQIYKKIFFRKYFVWTTSKCHTNVGNDKSNTHISHYGCIALKSPGLQRAYRCMHCPRFVLSSLLACFNYIIMFLEL